MLCGFVSCLMLAVATAPSTRPGGAITPPARRDVPGVHVNLKCGQLFLPDFFHPDEKQPTQLVIWTYGAAWCAEQNFYDARKNAAHLTVSTSSFKDGFRDAAVFQRLVDETNEAIKTKFPQANPIGRICIGSFSGG